MSRIGIFDSGVGGLSVLKELTDSCVAEYVYIGDSLRAPYGNKSREELLSHMKDMIIFLQQKKCDIFVNACNSLSSLDTEKLLNDLHIQKGSYVDMVSATKKGVEGSIDASAKVLLYATNATITSGAYQEVFKQYDTSVLVSGLLAGAIESGDEIVIDEEIDILIDTVIEDKITHVFLGCTHYPLIQDYLEKRLRGLNVKLINPAVYVPDSIAYLPGKMLSVEIYTTKMNKVWESYQEVFPSAKFQEVSLV